MWGIKLNASKNKTMRVSRERTTPLTLDGTVMESCYHVILGVTFDAKMTFEKHFQFVSRVATQRYHEKVIARIPLSIEFVKVKSSMARSLPVENLLPQKVGSIINYLQ